MAYTFRDTKGSNLTPAEVDGNFRQLIEAVSSAALPPLSGETESQWRAFILSVVNGEQPETPGYDFAGKTNVMNGDSMLNGYAINQAQRFSTLLNNESNGIESNNGIVGATLMVESANYACDRDHFDISFVPTYDASIHGFLWLMYGGNEVLINRTEMTPSGFKTQLTAAVNGSISKGWPASKIIISNGYYLDALNDAVGDCGVTVGRNRAIAEQFVTASNEVASEKATILIDMYNFTKTYPNRGLADGLHYDVTTHRAIATYLESLPYTPLTTPISAPVTLLTGGVRYVPPTAADMAVIITNVYGKNNNALNDQLLGKNMLGDGWVAEQYKSDSGISHYLFDSGLTNFCGYKILSDGTVTVDGSSFDDITIAKPDIDDWVIFGRFNGTIQLKYGNTLENATVAYDFGSHPTFTQVTFNTLADDVRKYLYYPQGLGLTNA